MNILLVYPYEGDQPVRKIKLKRALERKGHRINEFLVATSSEPGMGFIRRIKLVFRSLMTAVQKRGYDIIHMIEGWPIAQFPFLISKTPKVYDVRSHWAYLIRRERPGRKYRIWAWIIEQVMKLLVRHCDHTTIVDPQIAQSVLQMRPRSWSFLRNLPEKDFLKAPTGTQIEQPSHSGSQRGLVFGYLGAISRQRGITNGHRG